MKKKAVEETWKPIVLGCIFVFFGISNLIVALQGSTKVYSSDMGQFGTLLSLIFAFLFFGVSWGFFKRKHWSLSWGYGTAFLNLIAGAITNNVLLIGLAFFILVLSYLSQNELVNK